MRPARIIAPARPMISPHDEVTMPRAARSPAPRLRCGDRPVFPAKVFAAGDLGELGEEVSGKAIDSGHFMPEENPDAIAASLSILPFLSMGIDRQQAFSGTKARRPSDRRTSMPICTQHIAGFDGR